MIKTKADLRNRLGEVHLHMNQLKGIRQYPRHAAEPYVISFATNNADAHVVGAIRPLFKSNLPRGLAAPISYPFTTHAEVSYIVRLKNEHPTRHIRRNNVVGRLVRVYVSTAKLFRVHIPV